MAVPDYEDRFQEAVESFWGVRDAQSERQRLAGTLDAGTRGAVTGGKHMDGIAGLIARVFIDAGLPPRTLGRCLPGYYRGGKNWDSVVMYKGAIVAVIELQSQVGSFGKNQNNRIEEMIGQSLDIWRASREQLLGPTRCWFGYLMLLEDSPASRRQVRSKSEHFPVDPVFRQASYIERYRVAFERLRLEGDMNATCLAATDRKSARATYPDPTMSFNAFAAGIHARVTEIKGQLG